MEDFLVSNLEPVLAGFSITAAKLRQVGIFVICLILAITIHEFSHALAAHKLKDPTPEAQGRLTLNPMAHADPIGTLALPVILSLTTHLLFGWGRPVQTDPRQYTRKITMRAGMAIVAFAGPLSNLLLAALSLVVAWGLATGGVIEGPLSMTHPLRVFYTLNILLFIFNLIPVHPLDGGKVLGWLLGAKYQHIDDLLARWGFVIILVLMFSNALAIVLGPFYTWGSQVLDAVTVR